jgi:thiamine-phosphate pyrophosphorylase
MNTRIFLVAPEAISEAMLLDCAKVACVAADCATILVSESTPAKTVEALQALNLAVIFKDCDPSKVHYAKADGLLLSKIDDFKEARAALKNESLGFLAGTSRHAAMEAAELGADFICFTQTKQYAGEPIIDWWQDVTHIPSVAFDVVTDATVKPQQPDFIRPPDAMWEGADAATTTLKALMEKWTA